MVFVISAAVIAGTGISVYGQIQAGKAADDAAKEQARQAKIAADGEELKRREELNRILAANNASLAADGIATEGTPASIALSSAKDISLSEGTIGLSEKLKRRQTLVAGKTAKNLAYTQSASTLLGSSQDLYDAGSNIKNA